MTAKPLLGSKDMRDTTGDRPQTCCDIHQTLTAAAAADDDDADDDDDDNDDAAAAATSDNSTTTTTTRLDSTSNRIV